MKILMFFLLLALGANANEVVYGSKSGTIEVGGETTVKIVDVAAGEAVEIMSVIGGSIRDGSADLQSAYFSITAKYGELPSMGWQNWQCFGSTTGSKRYENENQPVINNMLVGPCAIQLKVSPNTTDTHKYQVSYKITKPAASNTTTSAPILLPPTPNAAASWFVKLQMSTDLKTWEDVQAGQFLGSDTARFFRIQTSEQ